MDIELARENMIQQQFRPLGVLNTLTLDLFRRVPREQFVPKDYRSLAFSDSAIPLAYGQQMLKPFEEALLMDALQIQSNERVLEIGTGSGYLTALLAQQAKHVESVDIFTEFTQMAEEKLASLNIHNVMLNTADAALGYKKNTQYDVIIVGGALPLVPSWLHLQLNQTGRLIVFLKQFQRTQATLIKQTAAENQYKTVKLFDSHVNPLLHAVQPNAFVF